MAGRKSMRDEVEVIRRYADLSGPYFKFLKECLEGEDKADKKWAADNLKGAYAKMIPQDLTTGGDSIKIVFDTAFQHETPSETSTDSSESSEIQSN